MDMLVELRPVWVYQTGIPGRDLYGAPSDPMACGYDYMTVADAALYDGHGVIDIYAHEPIPLFWPECEGPHGGTTNPVGTPSTAIIETPGQKERTFDHDTPGSLVEINAIGDLGEPHAVSWKDGAFVTLSDHTKAYWTGTRWNTGVAPDTITTEAHAGTPGTFVGPTPHSLSEIQKEGPLTNTTAWNPGEFVTLADKTEAFWNGLHWMAGKAPVPVPVSTPPTGVTPGTPGAFTGGVGTQATPADIAALRLLGDLGETAAWTPGQYVSLGDFTQAFWNGLHWETGRAPTPIPSVAPNHVVAGTPGVFQGGSGNLALPADLAALQALGALGSTHLWLEHEYIGLGDHSTAYWDGSAWQKGASPHVDTGPDPLAPKVVTSIASKTSDDQQIIVTFDKAMQFNLSIKDVLIVSANGHDLAGKIKFASIANTPASEKVMTIRLLSGSFKEGDTITWRYAPSSGGPSHAIVTKDGNHEFTTAPVPTANTIKDTPAVVIPTADPLIPIFVSAEIRAGDPNHVYVKADKEIKPFGAWTDIDMAHFLIDGSTKIKTDGRLLQEPGHKDTVAIALFEPNVFHPGEVVQFVFNSDGKNSLLYNPAGHGKYMANGTYPVTNNLV